MENRLNRLNELEAAVGVRFNDRALLQRAFVHRSYLHEADEETELQDNQRLEFLGDAVLSFIVSELLFRRYPERREGDLTNLRSALVKRETLSRFAKELRLGDYLLLGRGEEENGGRGRHTTLCDTYEAFIYKTVHTEGPDHARLFTRQVTIGKQPIGVGQGQSKQEAEQAAAAMALFRLGQTSPGYEDSGLAEEYELASVEMKSEQ